jgi:membrane protein
MWKLFARLRKLWDEFEVLLDDRLWSRQASLSRLQRFVHFWVLVGRSFSRARCPLRAAGLSYTTLLALIPMLAVVASVTSTFLKQEGEEKIDLLILKLVASVTPPDIVTNTTAGAPVPGPIHPAVKGPPEQPPLTPGPVPASTNDSAPAGAPSPDQEAPGPPAVAASETALPSFVRAADAVHARRQIARNINEFIQNTRSGALGVTGSVVLIFVAIAMLVRIEETFNDIWGVAHGRTWFMRIVLYWGVISLAPLLLVLTLGLATGPHLGATKQFLAAMPWASSLVFQVLPVVVLCLSFGLFYMLMPNTKVRWDAALAGGVVGGGLFHLNNLVSVLYVSRVVAYSKIYGSLGLVPVFMVGLYLSWTILLLGAQVAYAYQNRTTYFEEKQVENINQRGREFVALRLMTLVGQRFLRGQPPPGATPIAEQLGVPTRLVRQIMQTLCAARLAAETTGPEPAYLPARPLETITCHDILMAMRSSHGQELATREEPSRGEVYGEFQRIQEAERQAASSVTILDLVHRAFARELSGAAPPNALPNAQPAST